MLRFSPLQLLLLSFGVSLILLSLLLNQINWPPNRAPEVTAFQWRQLKLVPRKDQRFDALDPDTLVVRTNLFPSARLTLFTRPEDGTTPKQVVQNLCRRDSCTYSPFGTNGHELGAAANYHEGEPLRIVLMRPAGGKLWLEFKGPPEAYEAFSNLIDSVWNQVIALPSAAANS